MQIIKQYLFAGLLAAAGSTCDAQMQAKPWIGNDFPPVRGQYEYRKAHGDTEAAAWLQLQRDLCSGSGVTVKGTAISKTELNQSTGAERDLLRTDFSVECGGSKVWCHKVDECTQDGNYHALYEISRQGDFKPYFPKYKLVDVYSKPLAVALSFVPFGAAQFYKGNSGWGAFFLVGEALAIGGAGYAWYKSDSYYSDFANSHNSADKADYKALSQTYETLFYVATGVAGGLYLSSLLHGIFADGKRLKYEVAFAPYVVPQAKGVALSLNF
ncbi:hypothetical protein AGMMS4956_10790 [Bacteroidia bacterium]|nr:hypothetical protein AGMMS4956_10790 [Bacteroidia bacterium]